jgi:hypothetical protein
VLGREAAAHKASYPRMPVMGLWDEMEQALSRHHCYKDWYNDAQTGCRSVQPN